MFLSAAGNDNQIANAANADRVSFTIKDTRLYLLVVTLPAREIKNYQSFMSKDLKDQVIGTNMKQKVTLKIQETNLDFSLNQIVQEFVNYLF